MRILPTNTRPSPPPAERGFTLVEVLVALVILSVALLGLAGLQVSTLQNSDSAQLRTQAAMHANDMAERMHANLPAIDKKYYTGTNWAGTVNCSSAPTTYCADHGGASAAACTPQQMADYDGHVWWCGIKNDLPNANASITCATGCANPGTDPRTITITWDDKTPTGVATRTVSMTFVP